MSHFQLQFKIVTARGDYLVANACQNTDLFWALKGGGGGTYGLIIEATTQYEPQLKLQVADVNTIHSPPAHETM